MTAPARRRTSTVEQWPPSDATIRGEYPSLSSASTSVLVLPSRVDTTRLLPLAAARCSGVRPNLVRELGQAPLIRKLSTMLTCPPSMATCNETHASPGSTRLTSAPAMISFFATASWPHTAATCSADLLDDTDTTFTSEAQPHASNVATTSGFPPSAAASSIVRPRHPLHPAPPLAPALSSLSTRSRLPRAAACSSGARSHSAHCSAVAPKDRSLKISSSAPSRRARFGYRCMMTRTNFKCLTCVCWSVVSRVKQEEIGPFYALSRGPRCGGPPVGSWRGKTCRAT
ncbi:unnamed protein product, partial [Ectocarpus sp. 12 AP-2014]